MENKRLSYEEAQDLYNNYLLAKNLTEKAEYKKQLILGTMDYIKDAIMRKKIVGALVSMGYDQDEIINSALEIWIELLDAGVLNDIDGFNYNSSGFNALILKIVHQLDQTLDFSFVKNFNTNSDLIVDMIGEYREYIKEHERNNEILKNIIWKHLVKHYKKFDYCYISPDYIVNYINTFIDNANDLSLYLPLSQMKTNFNFLKSLGFTHEITQFTPDSKDEYGNLVNKVTYTEIVRDAINNCNLTDMQRDVIDLRFGLTGYSRKSLDYLAKKYKTTREYIRQQESIAFKKMRQYIKSKENMDIDGLFDDQYIKW